MKYINKKQMKTLISSIPKSLYRDYLEKYLKDHS